MAENCIICDKSLSDGATVCVERGIKTLRDASIERNDGKIVFLRSVDTIKVHVVCRKEYTRASSITAAKRERDAVPSTSTASPPRRRMRSAESEQFEFDKNCLFCGLECSEEHERRVPMSRRRKIKQVSTSTFKSTVLATAQKRNDSLGRLVENRIVYEEDLVAVNAKYHSECYVSFARPLSLQKHGRPQDMRISSAMEEIFHYIKNNDDCQFTLSELKKVCTDFVPDDVTVKSKLVEKYGKKIGITTKSRSSTMICFSDVRHDILNKTWYENRKYDEKEERFRILEAAAAIIREDIQSTPINSDYYPPTNQMFDNINEDIPESLQYLLEQIIIKNKKGKLEPLKLKCTALSHCIMSAVRPRSFISRLQIGLSVFLHRRFGSRRILDILSSLGLSSSYKDTLLYEVAAIHHPQPFILPPETGTFIQFAADNADINVYTIDGHNTIHIMGVIQMITPLSSVIAEDPIARLMTIPAATEIAKIAEVPIEVYEHYGNTGLSKITMENLDYNDSRPLSFIRKVDLLWMYGKWRSISKVPGWNNFMELLLTDDLNFSTSRVLFLPFIHQPASNYNTIYTTLKCALNNGHRYGHKTCIVTFDQPLYIKAREIVAASPDSTELSKVIVRLGGFHLLMSFLGSIGYIMAGSGLKDVLSVIYATNSVEKMLDGHAYARAIRAHRLLHLALATIIGKNINIDENVGILDGTVEQVMMRILSFDEIENSDMVDLLVDKFNEKLFECENRGPTARLWVQYFRMVSIAKEFIRAERMGDWNAHLNSIKNMLPYFHASGHFLYAKSAHLYLQDMSKLHLTMEENAFKKFTEGFFTIRRSNKSYCGTWSDMIIEQSLMKSMKTEGGVARGRSTQESVLAKWVYGMHAMNTISEGIEKLCNVRLDTADQHVDARDARVDRDNDDVKKVLDWFSSHDPFPEINHIMSISSGIIGDDKINCHNAYEIGVASMKTVMGQKFSDIKLKRMHRVLPLLSVTSSVKVHDTKIAIDPLLLFQRISVTKKFEDQLQEFLQYELAPYPLALFDEMGMRKTKKSALYDSFQPVSLELTPLQDTYIIDGGFLLHRVVWNRDVTYDAIFDCYVHYLRNHFGLNVTVVFDGYNNQCNNTKAMEQQRRLAKTGTTTEIMFDPSMTLTTTQEKFLSNVNNKQRFITMLSEKLKLNHINVVQAEDDADVLIINTAIELTNENRSIIVGNDVDLLVLLTALVPENKDIYFMKPGESHIDTVIYSSKSFDTHIAIKPLILFLHALTGCDTTSALFNKGKAKAIKIFEKRSDIRDAAKIFNEEQCSPDNIFTSGIKALLAIYGAPPREESLDHHRYNCFAKSTRYDKAVKLSMLPPTSSAAQSHLCRVYYQVQKWLGKNLNPLDWGWTMVDNYLQPIQTLLPPAPDVLLNTIFCNCTKGCGANCGCRKLGLHCSPICGYCHGQSCLNIKSDNEESKNIEFDENLDPMNFLCSTLEVGEDLEDAASCHTDD